LNNCPLHHYVGDGVGGAFQISTGIRATMGCWNPTCPFRTIDHDSFGTHLTLDNIPILSDWGWAPIWQNHTVFLDCLLPILVILNSQMILTFAISPSGPATPRIAGCSGAFAHHSVKGSRTFTIAILFHKIQLDAIWSVVDCSIAIIVLSKTPTTKCWCNGIQVCIDTSFHV